MDDSLERIRSAIAALEAQRPLLGDEVVATAVTPLRMQLEALRTAARPAQSLRVATILFMDIVGSTKLSGTLEPEDVHDVMDRALARITDVVTGWGGRVLQYAGDSLLAAFGAEQAREDDAARAVHAGLAILGAVPSLAADVERRFGHAGFAVRVGVHTGQVLLGGGVDAEGSIRGLAVNIAARMEQTAPPGALRISHDTYRQVRGVFDVAAQAPTAVKGVDEPMRSYLVLGAKPRALRIAGRGLEGVESRLVGREAELATMIEAYRNAHVDRRAVQVTVVGEPGIGKSRLGLEFTDWLEALAEPVLLFRARPELHGENVPFGVVRDLIAWRLDILEGDPQAVAKAKLGAGLAGVIGEQAPEFTALVGWLVGLDFDDDPHIAGIVEEGRQLRDRAFHAIAQYLRGLHAQSDATLVLIFDDLQWADDGSLDFVRFLGTTLADVPMLLLGLTRPALFERRPLGASGTEPHRRIDLAPLTDEGSGELVTALLGRLDTIPAALLDLLTTTAEGNAYFIEELIGMLVDDGVIVTGADRWQFVADRLAELKVPGTLAGVLQARLDALSAPEKTALEAASVVGHVFWDDAVRDVLPDADAALEAVARRDLSQRREPSAFAGSREFAFRHHLLHQVTYRGVLRRLRQSRHGRAAEWLIRRSGDRQNEYLGLIADHYERAGEAAQAIDYLQRAGEDAARSHAHPAAIDFFGRALALVPADDAARRFDLVSARQKSNVTLGRPEDHAADVAALQDLAEALDSEPRRAHATHLRASLALYLGDYAAVAYLAPRAVALGEATGRHDVVVKALTNWARALQAQGDFEGAAGLIRRALALTGESGLLDSECMCRTQLGILALARGRFSEGREQLERALAIARERGDRLREGLALNNLGDIEQLLGDYPAARTIFETCRRLAVAVGGRLLEAVCLANLAYVAFRDGSAAGSIELADEALAKARQLEEIDLVASIGCVRGHSFHALGRDEDAAAAYEEAAAIYRRLGRPTQLPEPLCGLARLALAGGAPSEAAALVGEVLAHLDAGGSVEGTEDPVWVYLTCHDVLHATGDARAADLLARGHAMLMARAGPLTEDERASFLGNVPSHRAVTEAWAATLGISRSPAAS